MKSEDARFTLTLSRQAWRGNKRDGQTSGPSSEPSLPRVWMSWQGTVAHRAG